MFQYHQTNWPCEAYVWHAWTEQQEIWCLRFELWLTNLFVLSFYFLWAEVKVQITQTLNINFIALSRAAGNGGVDNSFKLNSSHNMPLKLHAVKTLSPLSITIRFRRVSKSGATNKDGCIVSETVFLNETCLQSHVSKGTDISASLHLNRCYYN